MRKKYDEVNVAAVASTNPVLMISFVNVEGEKETVDFELSEQQVRWLIKALKQGRDLAFK